MLIRLLQSSDYAPLGVLNDFVAAQSLAWERPAALYDSQAFAAYCGWGCSYVAYHHNDQLGYLLAQPIAFNNDTPLTVWVDALAVHPAHRRCGVAMQLYTALGQHALYGTKGVLTRVPLGNTAALQLHHRIGFVAHTDDTLLWRLNNLAAMVVARSG